ncbi:hypothetical protein HEP84_24520 [Streptomyces sp. RLB1-33]|uniref:hypothetical protein n=1 Tax=Streptomyces mirabilis TaxID=68239 RepID=UPI00143E309A|nr:MULTISPECIES: hypothetical protein [Streptomyces]QIY71854.1 hypothetical protein HEP84_24520 [Streptomyces sp. RLB1-33]QUW81168.1 hypothetical protein SMIR_20335 [Streptomyces mirabilis]
MRRIALGLISAACGTVLVATPALADSPHFLFATNDVNQTSGALTTSFKEVGLGTGASSINITLTADATALYQCYNNGGNHPKARNKETVTAALIGSGTFRVRNGQTTGSLTVGPPGPGDFSCPSGQTLFLEKVTYSNTFVFDQGGTMKHATPDPIGTGTIHVPV